MAAIASLEKQRATINLCDILSRVPCLKELTTQQAQDISAYFQPVNYPKEAVIFYEQDVPAEAGAKIYFVVEGSIKLVKYSCDGESTIVRLASIGDFFGVTGALTNQPHPFSAEALTDASVLYINRDNFEKLVATYPKVALNMLSAIGQVLWFNYATHNQVVKKSEARVAKIILYHFKRDGATETPEGLQLRIQLPHDYIASMTGIAYEESVRIISRLKKQFDCIKYLRGGTILITNLAALKQIAQDDTGF